MRDALLSGLAVLVFGASMGASFLLGWAVGYLFCFGDAARAVRRFQGEPKRDDDDNDRGE